MSVGSSGKRTLDSLPPAGVEGLRALVRVDFNVPMHDGRVTDTTRIRAALPTIDWLRRCGCRIVLLSHLGRPKGKVKPELSLRPIVEVLEAETGAPVAFIPDATAADAASMTRRLRRGETALVENTRFLPGEEANARHGDRVNLSRKCINGPAAPSSPRVWTTVTRATS